MYTAEHHHVDTSNWPAKHNAQPTPTRIVQYMTYSRLVIKSDKIVDMRDSAHQTMSGRTQDTEDSLLSGVKETTVKMRYDSIVQMITIGAADDCKL